MKRLTNSKKMHIPFLGRPLIEEQIDEYCGYMFMKSAIIAGAHRALLLRYAKASKIESVTEISIDNVMFFVGTQLTGFYSLSALKALRSFLRFSKHAGYACIGYNEIRTADFLTPQGKPKLMVEDMPYSKIQAALNRGLYKGIQRA